MTKKILLWILVIFWMSLIFYFSSFNGIDSTKQSQGFLYNTLGKIIDIVNPNIDVEKKDLIIQRLDTPIRKIAHASVYFILAILVYLLLKEYNIKKIYLTSFIICFLYACSDEIHQLYVSDRSGELLDVMIDSVGSVMLLLFIYLKSKVIVRSK